MKGEIEWSFSDGNEIKRRILGWGCSAGIKRIPYFYVLTTILPDFDSDVFIVSMFHFIVSYHVPKSKYQLSSLVCH